MPIGFRGQIYAKSNAAASDAVRRFETSELKLSRCVIQVTLQNQSFGLASVYPVYYTPGQSFELVNVDLSTLYFTNHVPGSNGTVGIVGVYAD
jgi:hypothetical protein